MRRNLIYQAQNVTIWMVLGHPLRATIANIYQFRDDGGHNLYGSVQYNNELSQYSHKSLDVWRKNFALRGYDFSATLTVHQILN